MSLPIEVTITLKPVRGGFVVTYPTYVTGATTPVEVTEVATNLGKAIRLVKGAAEEFSLVSKKDEAGE